ncbi:hypothetical protein [Novosphingobium guangzhouense]|uniref:hypothetical protein n=1 Tax=Novosphingobium guangzhouense TaxID=1850347 RepID=UPI0011AEC3E4|nr:hypothetical protein [Novosphingobium guangzhouense]
MSILRENTGERLTSGSDIPGQFTPLFKCRCPKFNAGCGSITIADFATGLLSGGKSIEHPCTIELIEQVWKQSSRTSSTEGLIPMSSETQRELQPDDIVAAASAAATWSAACMSGLNPKLET